MFSLVAVSANAGRSHIPVLHVARDVVVPHDVLHALFHAGHFVAVVGGTILQPVLVIAVELRLPLWSEHALVITTALPITTVPVLPVLAILAVIAAIVVVIAAALIVLVLPPDVLQLCTTYWRNLRGGSH